MSKANKNEGFEYIYANLSAAAMEHSISSKKTKETEPATHLQIVKIARAFKSLAERVEAQGVKINRVLATLDNLEVPAAATSSNNDEAVLLIGEQLAQLRDKVAEIDNRPTVTNVTEVGEGVDLAPVLEKMNELGEQMDAIEDMESEVVSMSSKLESMDEDIIDLKRNGMKSGGSGTVEETNNFAAIKQMSDIILLMGERLAKLESGDEVSISPKPEDHWGDKPI